ncbi:MAG: hypothetical protein ACFFF4_12995 [Candidatus Thorarchaeota archaeon]
MSDDDYIFSDGPTGHEDDEEKEYPFKEVYYPSRPSSSVTKPPPQYSPPESPSLVKMNMAPIGIFLCLFTFSFFYIITSTQASIIAAIGFSIFFSCLGLCWMNSRGGLKFKTSPSD